jgi:class III poly(R)-hydroxyalkanoic acid synthase PhaE subunit
MSEKGEVIDSVQDLMNLWFDTVDETFTHTYVTEEYLEIQKNLAGASMKNKMQQQEILEVFMGMFDLPTRSELDDAYRSMNDLRKEVRMLKKEVKSLKGAPAPEAAAKSTPKKSTRSTSPKKTTAKKTEDAAPEASTEAT